jgi:hypothetical protein
MFFYKLCFLVGFSACKKQEKGTNKPIYDHSSTPVDSILKKDFFSSQVFIGYMLPTLLLFWILLMLFRPE